MNIYPSNKYTNTKKFKIALAVASGLFMFLFLLFFQPFGVNNYRPDEKITSQLIFVLFIFGVIVMLAVLLLEFVVYPRLFSRKNMSRHYLVWIFIELWVTSSITFLFYNIIGEFHDFYLSSYFKHIFEIGTILFISFLGTHVYFKHMQVVKNYENVLTLSEKISKSDDVVLLTGDYKNDQIALALKNIVFIKSEDNYASLNYIEENIPKKYLIRSTLTKLEMKIESDTIIRINRSSMVNLSHMESFKNHSGSLRLKLYDTAEIFVVSKSRRSGVMQLLKKISQ